MAIRFSIQRLTVISFPSSCSSRPSSGALVMFWIILSAAVIHLPASANGLKVKPFDDLYLQIGFAHRNADTPPTITAGCQG